MRPSAAIAVDVSDGAEAVPEGAAGSEGEGVTTGSEGEGATTGADGEGATEEDADGAGAALLPDAASSIAACWATHVVEAMGHPTPSPFKFWRVTAAALKRASIDAVELSVGNEIGTDGLLMTFPALMLFASSCN